MEYFESISQLVQHITQNIVELLKIIDLNVGFECCLFVLVMVFKVLLYSLNFK